MSPSRVLKLAAVCYVVFTLLGLGGCATLPGGVKVSKSEFDGTTHITQAPGWVGGMDRVKFGLSWNSKMPKGLLRLDAMTATNSGIATGESLHFNIDGRVINLASYDEKTSVEVHDPYISPTVVIPGSVWTGKSYNVPLGTIEEILKARRVAWRLDLSKDYQEGVLDLGRYQTTASAGFEEFILALHKVQDGQWPSEPQAPQGR